MATGQQQPYHTRARDPQQSTADMRSLPPFSIDHTEEPQNWQSPDDESDSPEDLRNDFAQFNLPLFEYARLHRLTSDYLSHNPLDSDLVPRPPADWRTDLEDPESTLNIGVLVSLGALNGHTTHEKLDIDKEAAELLAYVIKLFQNDDSFDEWQDNCSARFKDLKLEEPLLLSDPQLDLMRLKRRNMAVLSTDGLQRFADEEIEDLRFISPEKDAAMRDELERDEIEKLDIDRSTVEYLGEICNMPSQDKDDEIEMLLSGRKARLPSPETPPLLPSSPSLQALTLNAEVAEMEFTSSPEDLIREEAAKLESHILERDSTPAQVVFGYGDVEDVDLAIYNFPEKLNESSSSPFPRKRLKDLKVEGPLTPEDSLEHPMKKAKTVSFSEELQTLIPNFESEIGTSEPEPGGGDLKAFIESVVEPLAETALKQVQDERLDEFDTTLRVDVPPIDDLALDVPWKKASVKQPSESKLNSHRILISKTKNELTEAEKKWSGASKIERQLPWTPFPAKSGEVNIDEEFDDGSLARYLTELVMEDDIDVGSLICAPQALKVLQEDDDDLVLEPYEFEIEDNTQAENESHVSVPLPEAEFLSMPIAPVNAEPSTTKDRGFDMQTLLKMRKKELNASSKRSRASETRSGHIGHAQSALNPHQIVAAKPTRLKDTSTTASGLADFMRLHGRPLSTHEPENRVVELEQQRIPSAPVVDSVLQREVLPAEQQSINLASPTVTKITATFSIIVSPTVIADRDLMRELRKSLPGLEVVTRDLISSKSRDAKQDVSNEADITTSPSTGIITTTLQKLKQRPLPGQSTFFGVRDRIALVSCRYSRLIVLVSEGLKQSKDVTNITGPLDSHDIKAISDLIGFASSLEHDVEVEFVAGGESKLATWLAACISRTILVDDAITLMQEESIWERLLRQAGLNPFAAQSILAKLKQKDNITGGETSSDSNVSSTATFGLAAFIQMTTSRRLEIFGPSIGRRVIEKVSEVVDGGFIPNPHKGVFHTKRRLQ